MVTMLLSSLPSTPFDNSDGHSPSASSLHSYLPSPSILPSLKSTKSFKQLKLLHALAIKLGQVKDQLVSAEILRCSALSNDRDLNYALKVFDQMPEPNLFSWNTIIRALAESEHYQSDGIKFFYNMLHCDHVRPNQYTYPSVLKACAGAELIQTGQAIHGQVIKLSMVHYEFILTNLARMYSLCGFMQEAEILAQRTLLEPHNEAYMILYNILIDGYFRLGMVGHAQDLFDEMPNKSLSSWNSMIARYTQNNQFKEAIEIFRKMQMRGVKPNYVSLVSVLPAISLLGALDLGKWVHLYTQKSEIYIDDVLSSAILDMYSKCGNIEKAIQFFEELPNKNCPITWATLITGLALHGQAKKTFHYFEMMKNFRVVPTDVAFIGVLKACSHTGLVDQGQLYFDRMVNEYKIKPRIEHFTCMVDMLGRAGFISEAEDFINKMPIEPDDVIYISLLSACKLYGNIGVAERVANELLKLAPKDGGWYIILSNMYASLGDWEAMARVRLTMKELDIRKDPGCSWITIEGKTHEFLVEDDSHPRRKEIYKKLNEIGNKLKDEGYIADTSQVLININKDGEKENALLCHSEKIAIAFGLISTEKRTTLRIVKNLRVCMDCHSSIKIISRIYNRRIVLRDRNRFHHFENGACSCNDFW